MARRTLHQWHSFARPFLRWPGTSTSSVLSQQRPTKRQPHARRLRFEPLEDRRLLANVTVSNLNDVVDGNTSSIGALVVMPGADGISLREAILAANTSTAADTISFAASLTSGGPAVIQLTNVGHAGEIVITRNVTINGPGADLLAVQAFDPTPDMNNGDGSRVFNIFDGSFLVEQRMVTMRNLALTGGDVGDFDGGGAILNQEKLSAEGLRIDGNFAAFKGGGITSYGFLELVDCSIANNTGQNGGGVYGGGTIARSSITGNVASQDGGGLNFGGVITDCTIKYNQAASNGGGLSGGATITNTIIQYNTAGKDGGGVSGNGTLINCTIAGNVASQDGGGVSTGGGTYGSSTVLDGCTLTANTAGRNGGGIYFQGGLFGSQMLNTTVSGNSATNGGGIYLFNFIEFAVRHSTVVSNSADGFGTSIFFAGGPLTLDHSIVSNVLTFYGQTVQAHYSIVSSNAGSPLVEAPIGMPDANGNLIGGPVHGDIDPKLAPLGDNGGLLATHALLPGSPALNAGDLAAAPGVDGVPAVDGRGALYVRIAGGRIDIGAFERQSLPAGTLTVDTLVDEDDGHYEPGDLSLREAIHLAVGSVGADTITFAPALTAAGPASINLVHGALVVSSSLSILGPGADLLTIDASGSDPTPGEDAGDGSGVIFVWRLPGINISVDVTIKGLTITGADGASGIVAQQCNLTVSESRITGNSTQYGVGIKVGGGIRFTYDGMLKIYDSEITNNSAAFGGGISVGGYNTSLEIHDSIISNNLGALGGGGIAASPTNPWTITGSTVSNNNGLYGGGILTHSELTVRSSTISGNLAVGRGVGRGGGLSSGPYGTFNINVVDSTISGNRSDSGGGIYTGGTVSATRSTIVGNIADFGGGISASQILLDHAIVSSNSPNDLHGNGSATFSLIGNGSGATIFDNGTNLIGTSLMPIDPLLGPLADNGGPTLPDGSKMLTHALLPGSPAINAGRPTAVAGVAGVPLFDQRGEPFTRVSGGRIDIGAFELPPVPPALLGDYNQDGVVDMGDYIVWRKALGTSVAPYSSADGDGNGIVGQPDQIVWQAHFGQTAPPPAEGSGAGLEEVQSQAPAESSTAAQIRPGEVSISGGKLAESAQMAAVLSSEKNLEAIREVRFGVSREEHVDPRSSVRISNRPSTRASFKGSPALAASRRDDALVVWLAAQPNKKPRLEAFEVANTWSEHDKDNKDDWHFDSVDRVFALTGGEQPATSTTIKSTR